LILAVALLAACGDDSSSAGDLSNADDMAVCLALEGSAGLPGMASCPTCIASLSATCGSETQGAECIYSGSHCTCLGGHFSCGTSWPNQDLASHD
jgi:hypothetical protein